MLGGVDSVDQVKSGWGRSVGQAAILGGGRIHNMPPSCLFEARLGQLSDATPFGDHPSLQLLRLTAVVCTLFDKGKGCCQKFICGKTSDSTPLGFQKPFYRTPHEQEAWTGSDLGSDLKTSRQLRRVLNELLDV